MGLALDKPRFQSRDASEEVLDLGERFLSDEDLEFA